MILLLSLVLSSSLTFAEDTGKYRLTDYHVTLTPYSDGRVKMDYYQKWQVTEGHIPWISVGLPNDDYKITGSSLAIKKIADAKESDWSGVRIDLDRDYQPGQSFEIAFTIDETKLFYAKDSNYHLEFTPGWYDRAFIDTLRIEINCFFKLDKAKLSPKPLSAKDGKIIWLKTRLGKGEKFNIELSFPQKLFPKEIPKDNLKEGLSAMAIILIVMVALFAIFILILIFAGALGDDSGYSGGGIFFGGGGGISSSGGGGFGGSSSSCACACVSCACACACAGGGGAGCSRKTQHRCPICKPKKR